MMYIRSELNKNDMDVVLATNTPIKITDVLSGKPIGDGESDAGESLRDLLDWFNSYCRNSPVTFNAHFYVGNVVVAEWRVPTYN
jgi:hypothetical protein